MKISNRAFTFVLFSATVLLLMPLMAAAQSNSCVQQVQFFFGDPRVLGAYKCIPQAPFESVCYRKRKNPSCMPHDAHLLTRNRCPSCGSPIELTTGNTYIIQNDFAIPGLGGGLSLTRTWNSRWLEYKAGIFGLSWRSTYEERLYMSDDGYEEYARADGSIWIFATGDDGVMAPVAPADEVAALTLNNGILTLAFKDGSKRTFNDSTGLLASIVDRNGNTTTVAYDTNNRLSTVTDPAGRSITFNYPDSTSTLVSSVASAAGTFTYTYSGSFLTKVTRPDNTFVTFEYGDDAPLFGLPPMITAVKDTNGKLIEGHHYDPVGRGISSTRANGVDSVTVTYPGALPIPPPLLGPVGEAARLAPLPSRTEPSAPSISTAAGSTRLSTPTATPSQ